jgi:hypothetical protein
MKFQEKKFVIALLALIVGQGLIMAQDGDNPYSQSQDQNYSPQDNSSSSQPQPQYVYPEAVYPSQYPENEQPRDEARPVVREEARGGEPGRQNPEGQWEGGRRGGGERRRG